MSTLSLGSWGRIQVVIYDIDVTYFRGVPTRVISWASGDPFDDATAVIEFPSVTPYEILGVGDLFWLQPYANVEINLIRPNNTTKVLWEGMLGSIDDSVSADSSNLTIECLGALYQLDFYVSKPQNRTYENMRLYERAIADEFLGKPALKTQNCVIQYPPGLTSASGTDWKTRYSGSWDPTLTGYIQRLLSDMIHTPLDPEVKEGQWTLMKNPGRIPVLKLRDEDAVDYTVVAGSPGVTHDLKSDHSQAVNVIYGEGTDEAGTTWRNAEVIVDDTVRPAEATLLYHPLGWDETVHPAIKSESVNGAPTSPAPHAYDPNYVRVEASVQYNGPVSLIDARRSAQQQVFRELAAGHYGTITLGIDPPQGSRFEIKAGDNILLQRYRGQDPPIDMVIDELISMGIFTVDNRKEVILRGQYCTVLVRMLEHLGYEFTASPTSFTDVAGNAHQESIEKLEAAGIAFGYGDGTFGPNDELTRGQLAGLMVRTVEWAENTTLTYQHGYFYDIAGTEHEENINKAYENYLIRGNPNRSYAPNNSATRQQAGIVLQRINRFLGGEMLKDYEGVLFHVSQAEVSFDSTTVTLTVDSKFRDLATLAAMIERNSKANKTPARTLQVGRESDVFEDTKFPWDYNAGSGSIPKKSFAALKNEPLPIMPGPGENFSDYFVHVSPQNVSGNPSKGPRWTIVPVVASGRGTVQKTEIRAYDSSGNPLLTPFHVGVYTKDVTKYTMPPDAFTPNIWMSPEQSGESLGGADPSAVMIWGQGGQRAGFSPGADSEGHPVTGALLDDAIWQFQLVRPWEEDTASRDQILLWVAIYCPVEAWFQGRFYHGVQS